MGSDNGAGCVAIGMLVLVMIGMLIAFIIGGIEGANVGDKRTRAEAVEHGYGEWVPDKNGKTTFKWKEQ